MMPSVISYQYIKIWRLLDNQGVGIDPGHIKISYITNNKLKWGQVFLYYVILSVGLI